MSTHSPCRGESFRRAADAALSGGIAGLSGLVAAAGCCSIIMWPACGSMAGLAAVCAKAVDAARTNPAASAKRFIDSPRRVYRPGLHLAKDPACVDRDGT